MKLTSVHNAQIKKVVKLLHSASFRKETGLFVLEGARLCLDALVGGTELDSVFYTEKALMKYSLDPLLTHVPAERRIELPGTLYQKISDTGTPQGVTCVCKIPVLGPEIQSISKAGRYVALEDLQDPGNLGAIARTGEALGLDALILNIGCCDRFNPKALRASMGSLLRLRVQITDDLKAYLHQLNQQEFETFAAVANPLAKNVTECSFQDGSVLVIGNEGNGLSKEVADVCKNTVTIPIKGLAESLNAAAAASIFIWEMVRKR